MFGKVNLKSENQKTGIIMPASAIVGSSSQPQVYKVKNGKAVLHNITIAQKIKNKNCFLNETQKNSVPSIIFCFISKSPFTRYRK